MIIILVLVFCFGSTVYAAYDSEDDIPIAPQIILDYAITNESFNDFVISAHYRDGVPVYGITNFVNISFVDWGTVEYGVTYQMWADVIYHKLKIIDGNYEVIDSSYYGRSFIPIRRDGEWCNQVDSEFGASSWGRLDYSNFDIVHTNGDLIRKAGYIVPPTTLNMSVVPTKESIDINYTLEGFDSAVVEVYEYDFKNMDWNNDTKEIFDIPLGTGTFSYKEGVGNKFDPKKYYGFEILSYKDSQILKQSETVQNYGMGKKYQVLPQSTDQYIYAVESPKNLVLAKVTIEGKEYYSINWDDTSEDFSVEVQVKNTEQDFSKVATLSSGDSTYICSYSDTIESFRVRTLDDLNVERFSDWVVIDKDNSIVYHGNDYYFDQGMYANGEAFDYDDSDIMSMKPKLPTGLNPVDYIKYVLQTIAWYVTYILWAIHGFIKQLGRIPTILQQIIPFLPGEVTLMLSTGVAVSILLRLFGRK